MIARPSSTSPIAAVDAAVRAVLAGLGPGRGLAGAAREADLFAGRLLALRNVEQLPEGTRAIGVAPGTVVTPLARDFLKARGIALRTVAKGDIARVNHPGEWGFAIEEAAGSGTIEALRRSWLEDDWRELDATPGAAARWVAEVPVRGALVVTDEASVAVWRACRLAGVRAASVADPDAVSRAVNRLGVNLLVVEPAGKSISWMKQLGATFRRAGAPEAREIDINLAVAEHSGEACRCGSPR
jgi:hypothetical protein